MADQSFVSEAMQGNMAEVQLAQLAQQKSQSQDVKQFAQKMANDHTQMNQKWFDPSRQAAQRLRAQEPFEERQEADGEARSPQRR